MRAKLAELGEITLESTGRTGSREIRVVTEAPGFGLPSAATFEYRELFRAGRDDDWALVRYAYEYRTIDGGRRAYHFHDERYHAHCVDHRDPRAEHHYRAPEVDLFEAHDEFRLLYIAGSSVSCGDLRPALPAD